MRFNSNIKATELAVKALLCVLVTLLGTPIYCRAEKPGNSQALISQHCSTLLKYKVGNYGVENIQSLSLDRDPFEHVSNGTNLLIRLIARNEINEQLLMLLGRRSVYYKYNLRFPNFDDFRYLRPSGELGESILESASPEILNYVMDFAIRRGDDLLVEYLFKDLGFHKFSLSIDPYFDSRASFLQIAIEANKHRLVRFFLDNGFDPNEQIFMRVLVPDYKTKSYVEVRRRQPAIIFAIRTRASTTIVDMLGRRGADVYEKDFQGFNAIDWVWLMVDDEPQFVGLMAAGGRTGTTLGSEYQELFARNGILGPSILRKIWLKTQYEIRSIF